MADPNQVSDVAANLLSYTGVAGVTAGLAWYFIKKYTAAQESRIAALEQHVTNLEKKLDEQIRLNVTTLQNLVSEGHTREQILTDLARYFRSRSRTDEYDVPNPHPPTTRKTPSGTLTQPSATADTEVISHALVRRELQQEERGR